MTSPVRLPTLDAMRGLVMAIMAIDHVDSVQNARHTSGDAAWMASNAPLSAPDFLTRWCTHLCAPTFVFLAGAGLALAAAKAADSAARRDFDRRTAIRGALLLLLEFTYLSACFRTVEGSVSWAFSTLLPVFAQVIFAIGIGMLLMVWLRRLPPAGRLLIALGCVLVVEWASQPGRELPLPAMLFVQAGFWSANGEGLDVLVLYPALAWLPVMLLGHVVGERLAAGRWTARHWLWAGLAALALFALLRGLDGFGNAHLHRRSGSLLEWLHCSKYPASATFLAMELGLMALLLAWWSRCGSSRVLAPLAALGQVPLCFYLLHFLVIGVLVAFGVFVPRGGAYWGSWLGALLVVAICWWPCMAYRRLRRSGRHPWTAWL
ncbi:MAG: DUF1624 domain-containing protein [Planctomycetes bacterium]|nr:DUF1624 domain-containing protein [Planctomycetota bacterium]